jgi:cation transporter-like permease
MGFLNLFSKPEVTLVRLPSGSFTVDRFGEVLASTLPSNFPEELMQAIAGTVLASFRAAGEAQLVLAELHVTYPSLRITARELRGGAIMFLSPQTPYGPTLKQS